MAWNTCGINTGSVRNMADNKEIMLSDDSSGFVSITYIIPKVILDIRYYSNYNFIGERIDGYKEPVALLTKEAAMALEKADREIKKEGFALKFMMHTDRKRQLITL